MEISIKIGNEYLDLLPNTTLDLEEENPFLQLGAEIKGQYSLPFSVPCTEKNMRLLGYPNVLQVRKLTTGIEAALLINGVQHSRGQVKIETSSNHINHPQKGSVSLFYLFGVADFYKLIENKLLTDLDYGASYSKTTSLSIDPDFEDKTTFLGYITDVMRNGSPDTHEFAIFPVLNEGDPMNKMVNLFDIGVDSLQPEISFKFFEAWGITRNNIMPFPYLHWVIKKVFENIGWQIKGDMLEDALFKKICLLHSAKIDRYKKDPVEWNMRDHMPRVAVSTFLIGLANRFGLWFDFDYKKKVCTIRYRKLIMENREKTDITKMVGASYSAKLSGNKSYALAQAGGYAKPDFSRMDYKGEVNHVDALPAAVEPRLNDLYFVRGENAYYFCTTDKELVIWEKSTDNSWDYIPTDKTDDITVNCLVPGMTSLVQMKNSGGADINRWFVMPTFTLPPDNEESETFYICYHFGLRDGVNKSGSVNHKFPMASAGCHDLHGNLLAATSLCFEYPGNRGLYENYWQYFMTLLKQREEITIPINFNLVDLINFDYKRTVVIRNTEYFIKNPHFSLPLKDFINVELVRL